MLAAARPCRQTVRLLLDAGADEVDQFGIRIPVDLSDGTAKHFEEVSALIQV